MYNPLARLERQNERSYEADVRNLYDNMKLLLHRDTQPVVVFIAEYNELTLM
jgi:hypothetical protein